MKTERKKTKQNCKEFSRFAMHCAMLRIAVRDKAHNASKEETEEKSATHSPPPFNFIGLNAKMLHSTPLSPSHIEKIGFAVRL